MRHFAFKKMFWLLGKTKMAKLLHNMPFVESTADAAQYGKGIDSTYTYLYIYMYPSFLK